MVEIFDDCRVEKTIEGRFIGGIEIIKGELHVHANCDICGAEVYHVRRSDLKTSIAESIRTHMAGYTVTDQEGNVLLESPARGLRGAIQIGDSRSDRIACTRCGTRGTFTLKWKLTDAAFEAIVAFRKRGEIHLLHGGLIDIRLKLSGARFKRGSNIIEHTCNAELIPERFAELLNNFCAGIERYLQEGGSIPEPIKFEEKIRCVCQGIATLSGTIKAKIPKVPHKFARAVREWDVRRPIISKSHEELEVEPTY